MAQTSAPADSGSPFHYPIALNVVGRRCVVVGAGRVGGRKAAALAASGADVLVVAPAISSPDLPALIAADRVRYEPAPFTPGHLQGTFLVIAAADRPDVNAAVTAAARECGVLVSVAGAADVESDGGDFVSMAAVQRGDLVVGVTAGGSGPAVAARLRDRIDATIGQEWGPYMDVLREARAIAKRDIADPVARALALRRLAGADVVREKTAAGDTAGAWREAMACLSL
jgi:precorrin-2 dehydrogenase/sirohydrochlorin ferrochelatase